MLRFWRNGEKFVSVGVTCTEIVIEPRVEGLQLHVATLAEVSREMHPGIFLLFAKKVTLLEVFTVAVNVVRVL